ncbi:nucleotide exchange factor GrpE [Bradymonadaceae bacterium TMQ3]|nr:nucleotide exchange factor GrpE [Bradymonadaceae bacterium TMQ3]TXC77799.1 nucleotide exchange factor GrpE [Bradymonadales bacterium TMQ1]
MAVALLILMTAVAFAALALFFSYHRRELRRLQRHHRAELEEADDDHSRRVERLGREHSRELQYAHHPVVRDLLPALDALDEGLRHSAPDAGDNALYEGLELARGSLVQALARHGIERVEPGPGDSFDPQSHEAVATRASDEVPAGSVLSCLRAGYRHQDRQLRAAMVEVASDQRSDALSPRAEPSPPEESSSSSSEGDSSSISSAATSRLDSPDSSS